jgi:hypothetical protein
VTLNHNSKNTLTRTGVGPFEIGVRICSVRSKTGLDFRGGTVVGVIGSNSTVSSEQTEAVAEKKII